MSLEHQEALQLHMYLDQLGVIRESETHNEITLSLIGRVNAFTEHLQMKVIEREEIIKAAGNMLHSPEYSLFLAAMREFNKDKL